MSWQDSSEPRCDTQRAEPAVETIVVPRARDLGGFEVRRVLPAEQRQMVGPFIFFDQMGPASFAPGRGVDVRPHPHIGLSTVTFLFEGELTHRDSLGTAIVIEPGEVNWMTAGRGIAHSERSGAELRRHSHPLFGIQAWLALPHAAEETEPAFVHLDREQLPMLEAEGKRVTLIAGELFGARAPVATHSALFYAAAELQPGATLELDAEHQERAIYLVSGRVRIDGVTYEAGQLLILRPRYPARLDAVDTARLMLIGGEPMDGPRHIWWNFVSSSKERIAQANQDWLHGRFARVPGDDELIPLPES